MKDDQFDKLMYKLEEIRCGIIDVETNTEPNNIADKLRTAFYHQLEAKTGWGRNEIKAVFEVTLDSVL